MASEAIGTRHISILSSLLLSPRDSEDTPETRADRGELVLQFGEAELAQLLDLADRHHVIVRALEVLCGLPGMSKRPDKLEWALAALDRQRARIANALSSLQVICATLEKHGCPTIVIKSLDHWPDLGSDLDLFTTAKPADVLAAMSREFEAEIAPRSWGDRLAGKWNFHVPCLPELVEIHVGRLGQTGEQVAIARNLMAYSTPVQLGSHCFRLPAAEDRILISTLQRMYRHFYLRLCDVVDIARLLDGNLVDYAALRRSAQEAGLWRGVAAYLLVVSDYVAKYRGKGIELPEPVVRAARFGGNEVHFKRGFLRIPITPHAMGFYAAELARLARNGELENTLRLSLLPGLATAAALEQKFTGSDKGIW